MRRKSVCECVRPKIVQQLRRALDVREQERDGPGWEVMAHMRMMSQSQEIRCDPPVKSAQSSRSRAGPIRHVSDNGMSPAPARPCDRLPPTSPKYPPLTVIGSVG